MADTITLNIDNKEVQGRPGMTVLQVAQAAGVYIPTLCYHPLLEPYGGCRMCIVEIEKMRGLPPARTRHKWHGGQAQHPPATGAEEGGAGDGPLGAPPSLPHLLAPPALPARDGVPKECRRYRTLCGLPQELPR